MLLISQFFWAMILYFLFQISWISWISRISWFHDFMDFRILYLFILSFRFCIFEFWNLDFCFWISHWKDWKDFMDFMDFDFKNVTKIRLKQLTNKWRIHRMSGSRAITFYSPFLQLLRLLLQNSKLLLFLNSWSYDRFHHHHHTSNCKRLSFTLLQANKKRITVDLWPTWHYKKKL